MRGGKKAGRERETKTRDKIDPEVPASSDTHGSSIFYCLLLYSTHSPEALLADIVFSFTFM